MIDHAEQKARSQPWGLFIAASITTAFATVLYGLPLARLAGRKNWRLMISGFRIVLPLQPLTFYSGLALTIVSALYAPLTEELAKWLTLLVPAIRRGPYKGFFRYFRDVTLTSILSIRSASSPLLNWRAGRASGECAFVPQLRQFGSVLI